MLTRRTVAAIGAASAVVAAMVTPAAEAGGTAPGGLAPKTVRLGNSGFGAIALDWAHRRVLISEPKAGAVAVLGVDGKLIRTIPGQPGAGAIAVVGSTAFVVTTNAIRRINLTTLRDAGAIAVPGAHGLTFAGGLLWTGLPVAPNTSGYQVASVHPTTRHVVRWAAEQANQPLFRNSPTNPYALYLADIGTGPMGIRGYNIVHGRPVPNRKPVPDRAMSRWWPSVVADFAVAPDGNRMVTASVNSVLNPCHGYEPTNPPPCNRARNYDFIELRTPTRAPDGVAYPGGAYPSAVAMAPGPLGALRTAHAGLLALGLDSYGPDLKIFALGVAVPIATARVGVSGLGVIKSGLLITPDARTIFAVTPHDVYNTNISVQVLPTASLL